MGQQQPEVAVGLFEEAHEARMEKLGPSHQSTLVFLMIWGLADWMRGDLAMAAQRLEQAVRNFAKATQNIRLWRRPETANRHR